MQLTCVVTLVNGLWLSYCASSPTSVIGIISLMLSLSVEGSHLSHLILWLFALSLCCECAWLVQRGATV